LVAVALIVLAVALILIPAVAFVLLTLAHQASVVMTAVLRRCRPTRAGARAAYPSLAG
jgi:hypothetical protein